MLAIAVLLSLSRRMPHCNKYAWHRRQGTYTNGGGGRFFCKAGAGNTAGRAGGAGSEERSGLDKGQQVFVQAVLVGGRQAVRRAFIDD
ncbi:MAG: hypothetical protein RSF79_04465, partial [Janthinobacterium sp.]